MKKIQKCGYFKEPYQQCVKAEVKNKKGKVKVLTGCEIETFGIDNGVLFKHRGKLMVCDDEIYEQIKNESDAVGDTFFEKRIDELLE